MRAQVFILLSIVVSIMGCDPDEDTTNINGEYIGVFERNGNGSAVNMTFNQGTFDGVSEFDKFPAICNGSYSITETSITFDNACIWTADFDWTLILEGEWNYDLSGNVLVLVNATGDQYTLQR